MDRFGLDFKTNREEITVKKFIFLCALVVAACFLVTSQASAATVGQLFQTGPNQLSDEDRGYLIDRVQTNVGQIDIGDSIRGHLNFNTINSAGANLGGGTGNSELSGVYQLLVADKVDLGGGNFNYTFLPDPAFQADIGGGQVATGFVPGDLDGIPGTIEATGAIAVLFEDFNGNIDFTADYDDPAPSVAPPADPVSQASPGSTTPGIVDDGTLGVVDVFGQDDRNDSLGAGPPAPTPPSAADVSVGPYASEEGFIATAYTSPAGPGSVIDTDSVHWITIGFVGADGIPGTADDATPGPGEGSGGIFSIDNVLSAFLLTSGTSAGNVNFGFNVVQQGPGFPGSIIINRVTPSPFGAPVDFAGSQQIRGVQDLDTPFELSSNTNVSFNATVIPEPATMLLFGSGLLGLAALGRRRKKA